MRTQVNPSSALTPLFMTLPMSPLTFFTAIIGLEATSATPKPMLRILRRALRQQMNSGNAH